MDDRTIIGTATTTTTAGAIVGAMVGTGTKVVTMAGAKKKAPRTESSSPAHINQNWPDCRQLKPFSFPNLQEK